MSVKNFVQCGLVTPIATNTTELVLEAPTASYQYPATTGGTLVIADSVARPTFYEIISYTHRIDNVLYGVVRAKEGTTARAWTGAVWIYQALTAQDYLDALALKANAANAALTGVPTAPTAAPGTNSNQIATMAALQAAIAALIESSPAALDTLNELAAALGDDPNFASTMTTALAGKEPSIAAGTAAQMWLGNKTWATVLSQVQAVLLTGLGAGTNSTILASDTLIAALAKIQNQLNNKAASSDSRLTDAREWTAAEVTQAEAEAGAVTTVRKWSPLRVWQAVLASSLTGINLTLGTAVTAADTVLIAIGKLQKQITDAATNLAGNVRSTVLAGYVTGSSVVLASTDTVLAAFGKLQAQITSLATSKLDANANAVSASKLQTARTIGGVSFDGSANINLPGVNAAGNQSTSGNAATATKLATARTIALSGGVTGSGSFDGTDNLTITASVADDSHNHIIANVDGLQAALNAASGLNSGSNAQDPNLAVNQVILSNHANTPGPSAYWHITTTFYASLGSDANRAQIAVQYNGGNQCFARSCYGNVWTAWVRLDNSSVDAAALTGVIADARLSGTYTGVNITGSAGSLSGFGNPNTSAVGSTITYRDTAGDVHARLFRGTYANQTTISGAMAFRINNSTDNFLRYCSDQGAIRTWLGLGSVNNTSDAAKPVSTAQQTALNLKANLSGPALTGVPTAPTAADGTSTTQLATTAFVQGAVGGYLAKAVTGGTVVLTSTEASNPVIGLSGALTSNLILEVPVASKRIYSISNGTTGAFTVTVKVTGLTPTVLVAQGKRNLVYTNGVGAYDAINDFDAIALTGVSTCVTAAVGTNNTQIASTAYTVAEISSRAPTKTGVGASGSWPVAITGNAATATQLATARTIGGVSFNGTANINLPGVNVAGNQSTTGNAATATKLATARTINGVSFNGTANITVADATKLPLAGGNLTGAVTSSSTIVVNNTTASTSATTGSLRTTGGLGVGGAIFATGNITAYSDIRLKTNIQLIPNALGKVCQLRGVTYERIDSGEQHTGLIAQEVQAVLPEAVNGDEYLGVAYGNMVGLLVEAVKELKIQVDNQAQEIAELRAL